MTPEEKNRLKELRNSLSCWQDDYDSTEDKEQFDMFGEAIDAVERLVFIEAERDALQQQVNALAAENLARGEIIERLIGHYSCAGYHAVQNSINPAQSLLYDAIQVMKQPTTEAIKSAGAEVKS